MSPKLKSSSVLVSQHAYEKHLEIAREIYTQANKAKRTKIEYARDWRSFLNWCTLSGVCALPAKPDTVANYIVHLAEENKKVSTIKRALVSISQVHKREHLDSPCSLGIVRETLKGAIRLLGAHKTRKTPLLVEDLMRMLQTQSEEDLMGVRNRALLLLGFSGALRRSELVGLNVEDLHFVKEGIELHIHQSKTDQEQEGQKIGIPYGKNLHTCPVRAIQTWIYRAQLKDGPLFRAVYKKGGLGQRLYGLDVARIIKRIALLCGLDPAQYAGHSLRAGLVTTAAKAGKAEHVIMKQTRHRSIAQLREYIRDAHLFEHNAAKDLGL